MILDILKSSTILSENRQNVRRRKGVPKLDAKTKATVIERPGVAAFRDVTLTPKHDDTVVCRTVMSAISTGTDMKTYHGLQHPEQCWYPLVPGYENMGVVEEEGSYMPELKKGDRVMINECRRYVDVCSAWGGGTHRVHKDSANTSFNDRMCRIPDNVTDEQAVLAYLALVPLNGVLRFSLRPSDVVCVFGAGMVGISAMQELKIVCPGITVVAVEPHPYRRSIAAFYADHVITPDAAGLDKLREITGGKLADKIIECSGNPAVPGMLCHWIKWGGWRDDDEPAHIHLNGDYPERLLFDHYHHWFVKNATLTMSCGVRCALKEKVLRWIADGKFDTQHLPYEVWPAGKAAEAFARQHEKGMESFKILFDWRDVK